MALDKCVGFAPDGVPPPIPAGDLRYPGVQGFFTETGTKWVRLVAEWEYYFQGASSPANPPATFYQYQAAQDANVTRARQLGLRVILVTRGFPVYAGSPDPSTWPPISNLGPTGPYAQWILYLMDRYHPVNRYASGSQSFQWIDFFEVVNEPNYEIGPQSESVANTAQIFSTALGIAKHLNATKTVNGHKTGSRPLRLLGPATADYAGANTDKHTDYATFTSRLLSELRRVNFPMDPLHHRPPHRADYIFAWAHHNYDDVRDGMPMKVATTVRPYDGNRAQLVRRILRGTWGGYPSSSVKDPRIYLTEGGAYRGAYTTIVNSTLDSRQKRLLARAINRLKTLTGSGQPGDGIEMFTQFLFYTTLQYDSGLVRPPGFPKYRSGRGKGTLKRPAYFVWKDDF